jgi:hypothetical protein
MTTPLRYEVWARKYATDPAQHIGTGLTLDGAHALIACYRRAVGRVQCDVIVRGR